MWPSGEGRGVCVCAAAVATRPERLPTRPEKLGLQVVLLVEPRRDDANSLAVCPVLAQVFPVFLKCPVLAQVFGLRSARCPRGCSEKLHPPIRG